MDLYRRITNAATADLNRSFGNHMQNFRKLDPETFNMIKRQEQVNERMALAEQIHRQRHAATAQNVERVSAKKDSVRSNHNDRIKKRIQAQEERPQLEKRKPGRPKKLPLPAADPPARATNPSPS